jgi:hypothetical protein
VRLRLGTGLVTVAVTLPAAAAAQVTVLSARLTADLTVADGSASVMVEYRLSGAVPGTALPATVLDFGLATVEDLRVGEASEPVPLGDAQGVAHEAELPVEATDRADVSRVVVRYRVPSVVTTEDGRLRGRIPVLTVDRPPAEPGPGLFVARVRLPQAWRVTETFPTGLAEVDGAGTYEVRLSVVPAVVGFRARGDGGRTPGMPVVLDVLAAGIMGLFVLLGWRHLRRVAA